MEGKQVCEQQDDEVAVWKALAPLTCLSLVEMLGEGRDEAFHWERREQSQSRRVGDRHEKGRSRAGG